MAKECEKEKEAQLIILQKAQAIDIDKHVSADRIASLFRRRKVQQIEKGRLLRVEMKQANMAEQRVQHLWGGVQRIFRQYSTRLWLANRGVNFDLKR